VNTKYKTQQKQWITPMLGKFMQLNLTSIISRLTLEQDDKLSALLSIATTENKKSGDPLAVRFKPAVREYIRQVSTKLGVSASEFINMLIEGVIRETLSPFQTKATQVFERFQLVMDAHGLSITDIATLLSPRNIGLSVLENRERTLDYLTSEVIAELAEWFGVSENWLRGETANPIIVPGNIISWHGLALRMKDKIAEILTDDTPEIYLYRNDQTSPVDKYLNDTEVGICLHYHRKINGLRIRIAKYFGKQTIHGCHQQPFVDFMSFCGCLLKNGDVTIETRIINRGLFNLLSYGEILPVMMIDKINGEPTAFSWHKNELQPILIPGIYSTEEWLSQFKNIQ
jgi:transcriptional regulator with XRE-family HTH domain